MEQCANGRIRAVTQISDLFTASGLPRACTYGHAGRTLPGIPGYHLSREGWMYQAPKLERLGTFREVTLAGGDFNPGDGANPYHRYTALVA